MATTLTPQQLAAIAQAQQQPQTPTPLDFQGDAPQVTGQMGPTSFAGEPGRLTPADMQDAPITNQLVSAAQTGQVPNVSLPAPVSAAGLPSINNIDDLFARAGSKIKQAEKLSAAGLSDISKQNAESLKNTTSAIDRQAAAESEQEAKRQAAYADFMKRAEEIDNKQLEIQKQAAEQTAAQMNRVAQAAQTVQNTQFKDFFADKSTFAKILGVISQTLGGAANGIAGQPGAPTPLDRIIEQDMQLQMANFNKKKEDYATQSGLLNQMRQQTQDLLGAQVAYKKAVYDKLGVMIDAIGTKLGTPQTRADTLKAELAQQIQQTNQKYAESTINNINNALIQDARLDVDHANFEKDLAEHVMAVQAKQGKPARAGVEGVQDNEKLAGLPQPARAKVADKIQATKDFVNAAQELQRLYEKSSVVPVPGDAVSSQQEIAAEALARSLSGSTRPSIGVLQRAREIIGGPGGFAKRLVPNAYRENLQRVMADQLVSAKSYVKAQGLDVEPGSFLDPEALIKQGK